MWQAFLTQSTEAAKLAFLMLGDILSKFIGLLIIVAVGWLISKAIKALVVKILNSAKLDSVAESTGVNDFLSKGGMKQGISDIVGGLIYWLCLLIVAAVAVDFLQLNVVGELLNKIILYVPNVIVSIFILLAGIFISRLLSAMVQTAAANAGLFRAKLLSKLVEIIVIVVTITIALDQLNIGAELVSLIVKSIVIAVAAAIAIAFGLGCKEMAAKALDEWLDKVKEKK